MQKGESVRLVDNRDGTYSVFVYGTEVYRGPVEGAELRVNQEESGS